MDPKIRAFAVHCLEDLDDEELALYMLQLCQQLKFENYTDSALARFLLRRALANTRLIGHILFWQLQSEVYNIDVRNRFIALLQIYIQHCGDHRLYCWSYLELLNYACNNIAIYVFIAYLPHSQVRAWSPNVCDEKTRNRCGESERRRDEIGSIAHSAAAVD